LSALTGSSEAILQGCISPASFWLPEIVPPDSAWLEHAPFAFWLIDALRPRTLVELGTHRGFSYFAFCQAVLRLQLETRCYAVDTWKGDEHAGYYGEEVFRGVCYENERRYSTFSSLIRSTFDEASHYFSNGSIDLLHLDGRHFFDDVKHDFETWQTKLSNHAIVLLHDTNVRERDFGVFRFWEQLCRTHPHFEFLHGHGLGILGIGKAFPDRVLTLFAAQANAEARIGIQQVYSRLGSGVTLKFRVDAIRQALSDCDAKIAALDETLSLRSNEIAGLQQALSDRDAKIAALDQSLSVRSTEVSALQQALSDRDAKIAALDQSLSVRSTEVSALQQALSDRDAKIAALDQSLSVRSTEVSALQQALSDRETRLTAIEASTMWRATKPLRAVATRVPAPIRRRLRQMAKAGYWLMTPHKIPARIAFIRQRNQIQGQSPVALIGHSLGAAPVAVIGHSLDSAPVAVIGHSLDSAPAPPLVPTTHSMIRDFHALWAPFPVFFDRHAEPTLTIVTDGVDASRLFGGVGTSLVVGALAAREMNARLRLVTRNVAPDPATLGEILQAHKIRFDGPTDFVHMPQGDDRPLAIGSKDTLLTTSWWSTRAVLASVDPRQVLYLLQEDERMFYPNSDVRLLCSETISRLDLRTIVNTRLLFDHLADGQDPLPGLRERGFWFDPAFPAIRRSMRPAVQEGKKNFLFYARPNHPRNLYWRGLDVIDTVIRDGVLSSSEWNIHFIGEDLPDMQLPGGVRPKVWGKLPWAKYADLLSEMDLGLSLMDTPHPSYPPLDLAAAGAIVVTNTHGPKLSLEKWSHNIICAPPSVAELSDALRRGAVLADDIAHRAANVAADHIPRDWDAQLRPVMDWFLGRKKVVTCF
jgi:Methyltransferase domain